MKPDADRIEIPPLRRADGSVDPEHIRSSVAELVRVNLNSLRAHGEPVKGYDSALRGFLQMAKLYKISEADLIDQRTDAQIQAALLERLAAIPASAIVGLDREIAAMERGITRAVMMGSELILGDREAARRAHAAGKSWLNRLLRIRRLRMAVRNPSPQRLDPVFPGTETASVEGWESSHGLRVMVYAYRSDLSEMKAEPGGDVPQIAAHHARWAVDIWKARKRIVIDHEGAIRRDARECRGIGIIGPPRHGKTLICEAHVVLDILEEPSTQGAIIHDAEILASDRLVHVRKCFDPNEESGRRMLAAFPTLSLARKGDKSSKRMRLKTAERTQDPTLRAVGVRSSGAGTNNDLQFWDDVTSKDHVAQDAVREEAHKKLMQVWYPRLQGKRPFLYVSATLWHHEDAVFRLMQAAARGDVPLDFSVQRVGGPKTEPKFFALWPEMYPPHVLKQLYNGMEDPYGWSAQYECNPRPDDMRHVRRLRHYLCDAGECPPDLLTAEHVRMLEQHADFLLIARMHASLDPSATAHVKSDKAGLIYAGIGDVARLDVMEGGAQVRTTRTTIRVLSAAQFVATQVDAVQYLRSYMLVNRTDMLHTEAVAGFYAVVDMFRALGIDERKIVAHTPQGQGSKVVRLKSVAPMLEDATTDEGLGGAVVEFPATLNGKGEMVPKYPWLEHQVLDAGATRDDHVLDALTQLLKYLQPECAAQRGAVSHQLAVAGRILSERQQRLLAAYSEMGAPEKEVEEDIAWALTR